MQSTKLPVIQSPVTDKSLENEQISVEPLVVDEKANPIE